MNPNREEQLFQLALTKDASERVGWLDRECGEDKALRARLDALLAAHEQPETLLATEADAARPTIKLDLSDASDEAAGQTLGLWPFHGGIRLSTRLKSSPTGQMRPVFWPLPRPRCSVEVQSCSRSSSSSPSSMTGLAARGDTEPLPIYERGFTRIPVSQVHEIVRPIP
jgi:hypothetical protein